MIIKSGCKINIGLDITSRREEDGYHLLHSLFYPVHSLFDFIEVVKSDVNSVIFSQSGIEVDCSSENNLCIKAYRKFSEFHNIGGVKIHLHKNIPFGAGIGGGSSNAAVVIKMLNELFVIGASQDELCKIGEKVGCDVPFFIYDEPLMVSGTGNIFSSSPVDLSGKFLTLIKPNFSVSTAEAYSLIKPNEPNIDLVDRLQMPIQSWKDIILNDFETPIFALNSRMVDIKDTLYNLGADYVSMSGSGSSIYAISDKPLSLGNLFENEFSHCGKL